MTYGDLGQLMQGMPSSAKSPLDIVNAPPAAFRSSQVNCGERQWLDRSKIGRFQGRRSEKKGVKTLRVQTPGFWNRGWIEEEVKSHSWNVLK